MEIKPLVRLRYKRLEGLLISNDVVAFSDDISLVYAVINPELKTYRVYKANTTGVAEVKFPIAEGTSRSLQMLKIKVKKELVALGVVFADEVRKKKENAL